MTDRRLTPANGRVAAAHLRGQVTADAYAEGVARRVAVSLADLRRAPAGPRDRQIVLGDAVTVYEDREGWSFVQSEKDGYCGYVETISLADSPSPTHWVAVPSGHAYTAPDIKSPEAMGLVFGSGVTIVSHQPRFFQTHDGLFIPKPQLWPIDKRFADPVNAAQLFFGAPYLWGGNSVRGIDCSGLVQAALLAAGRPCPGDSDMQQALGTDIPEDAPLKRGDLLFWKGHVAMMVDDTTMIHANAHHMAVAYEDAARAAARIEAQGNGPVIARKRP